MCHRVPRRPIRVGARYGCRMYARGQPDLVSDPAAARARAQALADKLRALGIDPDPP